MKLTEACIQLSENYVDIQRFAWDEFADEMEYKKGRTLSNDAIKQLLKDYVKRFWMLQDRGMLPPNASNIEHWTSRLRSNPTVVKDWIRFIDNNM